VRYAGTPGPDTKEVLNPLFYGQSGRVSGGAAGGLWLGDCAGHSGLRRMADQSWLGSYVPMVSCRGCWMRPKSGAVELAETGRAAGRNPAFVGVSRTKGMWSWCWAAFCRCCRLREYPGANGLGPLLQVRLQFWMRELARVVSSVGPETGVGLCGGSENGGTAAQHGRNPVPGMRSDRLGRGRSKMRTDRPESGPRSFYRTFFDFPAGGAVRVPGAITRPASGGRFPQFLCPACLHFVRAESAP